MPNNPPNDPGLQNMMVLGPVGGGVSSVVNLIAGKAVAPVSNDPLRCTEKIAAYRAELRNGPNVVSVTLYGIPGFNSDTSSPLELQRVPISLAVIWMEDFPAHIKSTAHYLQTNWTKYEDGNVPVLFVINHIAPNLVGGQ